MKKLSFILLLICLVTALPAALAEQTLLTAVVPDEHTLSISYNEGGTVIANGTTLTEGTSNTIKRHEHVVIQIIPDPGYELETASASSAYGVTLQGNNIDIAQMVQDISIQITFSGTPISYTVAFDANGGTGTMADVTGVSGSYILPECEFIPPDGMRFKTWQINGSEYAVGSEIAITNDVTAIAIYEPLPTPPEDVVITHPTSEQVIEVYEGETASMAVTAENASSYQWFVNYGDGTGWHKRGDNQPGYTTSPVTLANNGYRYKCVASGTNGSSAESSIFTLRVLKKIDLPQTGDATNLSLLGMMLLFSTIGCLILWKKRNRITD